jgi:cephalosporin-C deacetylase-like acetyl esterase
MTGSCSYRLPRLGVLAVLSVAGFAAVARPASGQDYEFDRTRPATLVDRDTVVREVAYMGPDGESTDATLVTPARPGRYPAVLFVHWYGPEDTNSNRTQYVPDALALARHGVVSLLIDTPWSEPTWFPKRDPGNDKAFSVAQVKRLRRAMDVLAASNRVDPKRLAYVGHDFGAMYGAIVAGLDPRITSFVFVAGTSKFADWFTLGRKLDPTAREAVYKDLASFDPVLHVARVKAGQVLFQFATKDPYVSRAAADALVAAVSVPKESKFYDCGHGMSMEAMHDRVAWLLKHVGTGAGR